MPRAARVVGAGAVVKQRSQFAAGTHVDGFPAVEIGRLPEPPDMPSWALRRDGVLEIAPSAESPR